MALNPKLHKKLTNNKQATVSLDSLLGVLSSAYGTEEIDSKNVFEKNTINWKNLSVESFKAAPKRKGPVKVKDKKLKPKENECINVATSTTSLKPNKICENQIDITLVSIKSLENLQQEEIKAEEEVSKRNQLLTDVTKQESETKTIQEEDTTPSEKEMSERIMVELKEPVEDLNDNQRAVICGFYVDDADDKVVFDIQFTKKMSPDKAIPLLELIEPEISIVLVDILKQIKTHIKVGMNCLVSKVQYFANVDKEFGLDNLDTTIKCNSSIFQWVMTWVKADIPMLKPNLNNSILKAVLLMAYHLKIDQLVQECLDYLHKNCRTVLETDWDIEDVLDDELFLQLVVRFSNAEIDLVNNYFESFKERIYFSLIRLLVNPDPLFKVGHFSTLATLLQCGFCGKQFHYGMENFILCRSNYNQLNFKGDLIPQHERLPTWNLSQYIELMYQELQSWKTVYWRLWGKCHFLKCRDCNILFSLEQNDICLYHDEDIEYFPINSSEYYPIGSYKCCGEVAFRFNVLKPYSGCKFKSHTPELNSETEVQIYKVFETYKHFICCQPPENIATKKLFKLVKTPEGQTPKIDHNPEHFWWSGILLAPKEREDDSIIPQAVLNRLRNRPLDKKPEVQFSMLKYEPPVFLGIMPPPATSVLPSASGIAERDDCINEKYTTKLKKCKQKAPSKKIKSLNCSSPVRNKKKLPSSYQPTETFWIKSESNKDNQDNQRDFEEIAMRTLAKMLTPEDGFGCGSEPTAGTYIRLEEEWWCKSSDSKLAGTSKNSGTVVNRSFPLSWFRRVTI